MTQINQRFDSIEMPEVLIVAGNEDLLAVDVRDEIVRQGKAVSMLDGPSAARLFTIRQSAGESEIFPVVPMLLRSSAWYSAFTEAQDDDARFSIDEAFATLWAVAALTPARVINRPSSRGNVTRLTFSSMALFDSFDRLTEYRASSPDALVDQEVTWGEDADLRLSKISSVASNSPVHAWVISDAPEFEIVNIVGEKCFRETLDPRPEEAKLVQRSLRITNALNLHLASITWILKDGAFIPLFLNGEPSAIELRSCRGDVCNSLAKDLLS
jgi:hypothetical protein